MRDATVRALRVDARALGVTPGVDLMRLALRARKSGVALSLDEALVATARLILQRGDPFDDRSPAWWCSCRLLGDWVTRIDRCKRCDGDLPF